MTREIASEKLFFPTALSERLASEENLYFPPRRLTAFAKKGAIPSLTTADGKTLLEDGPATRQFLRTRKR